MATNRVFMNIIDNLCRRQYLKKRLVRRTMLACVALIPVLAGLTGTPCHSTLFPVEHPGLSEGIFVSGTAVPETDPTFTCTINAGDTLSAIFDRYHISTRVLFQILSADESLLALDVLRPGNRLTFTMDRETRGLISMELGIHPGKRVIYRLVEEGTFESEEIIMPGIWEEDLIGGDITGSFYLSARRAGLTDNETGSITELFRDHIRFARDMRAGDRFQVIRSRQYVDGVFTGQSRIEGVRIVRGRRIHSAFLFDDGNYYDSEGNSLARALRRYPTGGHYRVSSRFNPARLHPTTHRIVPHYGVDFAMPSGTPVLSIGDGVVTRIHCHPFAGTYLEVRHGSYYVSRYLHLSRVMVRRGQAVQRGERIALSGNSGRSTAPHLHYELHIKGRPVNPLTAKIPTMSVVPDEKRPDFDRRVEELVAVMEQPSRKLALRHADDHS